MLKLAKDILSAQAWQGAILICTFATQLLVARCVGASALGITAIIVSGTSLCVLLLELNLQSALVRAVTVAEADDRGRIRDNVLGARLVLASILAPAVGLLSAWTAGDHQMTIFWAVLGGVFAQELNPAWWLQGLNRSTTSFILAGCVAIVACFIGAGLIYFVRQPGLESLVSAAVGLLVYVAYWHRAHALRLKWFRLRAQLAEYGAFAWRHRSFLLGGVAVYLYLYPAQAMLAFMRDTREAGLYRVALMPGVAYYALAVAAYNAYLPSLVRARSEGIVAWQETARRIFGLMLLAGLVAWLCVIWGRGLLVTAFGHDFTAAADLARALILSKVIGGLVLVVRAGLLAINREKLVYGVFTMFGVIGLIGDVLVIPYYGMLGAAWVEIATESTHGLILVISLYRAARV
jgi:O-antigen/teichoic acid export membrane protein